MAIISGTRYIVHRDNPRQVNDIKMTDTHSPGGTSACVVAGQANSSSGWISVWGHNWSSGWKGWIDWEKKDDCDNNEIQNSHKGFHIQP